MHQYSIGVAGCAVHDPVTLVTHFVGLRVIHTPAEYPKRNDSWFSVVHQLQMCCCSEYVYLCAGCAPWPNALHPLDFVLLFNLFSVPQFHVVALGL